MCWKKLFGGGSVIPVTGDKVLLHFAIDDYPGTTNDLSMCLDDQNRMVKGLKKYWPDFEIRTFTNNQVTRANFLNQLIEALKQEWDTIMFFMDCCHAESNTRDAVGIRYFGPQLPKRAKVLKRIARTGEMKHLAFSASQDYQTASDGCFTPSAISVLHPEMTYYDWFLSTKTRIAESHFDQIPELEGPIALMNKKVFSDRTLIVGYSGHGSRIKDTNGDEPDGYDETLYVIDGHILDDKIADALNC